MRQTDTEKIHRQKKTQTGIKQTTERQIDRQIDRKLVRGKIV